MKKIILIGRSGNGKTTLTQKLSNEELNYRKTQSLEFSDYILDTPGEYIEHRRFYHVIISAAVDCDVIGLIQAIDEPNFSFPPGFGSFFNKPVIGIITKVDIDSDSENVERALLAAGVQEIFKISSITGEGLIDLKAYLEYS